MRSLRWIIGASILAACLPGVAAPGIALPFDEDQGTVVHDTTGHVTATLKNGASWVSGIHGSAVSLDPKQRQYVELSRAAVNTTASFTVSAWVKLNHLGGTQTFVSQSGTSGDAFDLSKLRNDTFAFSLTESAGSTPTIQTVESVFSPTPGLWYQITGVYDTVVKQIRLYADGLPLGSAPITASWKAAGRTEIGCDTLGGTPSDFADGAIDEVRLFPRALSDAQVAAQHKSDMADFLPNTFTWANPIYFQGNGRGDDIHDPDIIRDSGVYYAAATLAPFANYTDRDPNKPDDGSSPGVALYASRDLKVWKFKNWLLKSSELPQDCPYKHQFWAPEIHKLGKLYYLIFGGSNWFDDKYNIGGKMGYYQFIGVADKITGPYAHFTALKGPGVDTSLFQDDDGKTYVVWPWNEIHAIDLTRIDKGIVTVGPKISQATTPEAFQALGRPVPGTIEGPYLIKRAGTYYCFYAETYPDLYATGIATAKSLSGPWTLDPRWRVFPGGHQAEFIGPDDRWWTAYKHEHSDTTPWLSIDPLDFDAAGDVQVTPTGGPQHITLKRAAVTR